MPKVGDQAAPAEVRARWAYSELRSDSRFASTYTADKRLFDESNAGTRFDDLSPTDKADLETVTSTERTGLFAAVAQAKEFECQSWTKAQICRCFVVPALDPQRMGQSVPLISLLASPRFNRTDDPRDAADNVPLGTPFVQIEAVCIVPTANGPTIIDGTGRAILFLRTPNLGDELLVWFPV